MFRPFKVGLALGGGGARGISHLGVLSALEKAGVPIDLVAGVSFGAVVGAMYAIQPNIQEIENRITTFVNGPEFKRTRFEFMRHDLNQGKRAGILSKLAHSVKRGVFYGISFTRQAYISEMEFLRVMGHLIDDVDMENTKVPFFTTAADLINGGEYILDKGSLRKAICATCAIPGIFPPMMYGEHLLMDGGWVNPVPVDLLRQKGADFVIAVNASDSVLKVTGFNRGLDLLLRADALVRERLRSHYAKKADVIIQPDVGKVHWADFSRPKEYMQKGKEATETKLEEVKRKIRWGRVRRIFPGNNHRG
ncbi:MAG TPA: patatin-like phospholipase family protein [Nitrospiria bacterium]|jgi:NTE family protein